MLARPRPCNFIGCRTQDATSLRRYAFQASVRRLQWRYGASEKQDLRATPHGGAGAESFAALAKELAGRLASEFASNDDSIYDKLEIWLKGAHDEDEDIPPRTDQTTEESDGQRLVRLAGEVYDERAHLADMVTSVKSWLSNPVDADEQHDRQMVSRLLHRLLESYQEQAGEEFDPHGPDTQYDRLHGFAQSVLGDAVPRQALKSLVRAYFDL